LAVYKTYQRSQDLPSFESDLDELVSDGLLKAHLDAVLMLREGKATLVQVLLNVLKLSVVIVFVLDFLVERARELATTTLN
jgi:hypothetical protein